MRAGRAGHREPPRPGPHPGPPPAAFKNVYSPHPAVNRGPRSFEPLAQQMGGRPAMFRHSYAEPLHSGPGTAFVRELAPPRHQQHRFGLASLKPY